MSVPSFSLRRFCESSADLERSPGQDLVEIHSCWFRRRTRAVDSSFRREREIECERILGKMGRRCKNPLLFGVSVPEKLIQRNVVNFARIFCYRLSKGSVKIVPD